MLFSGFLYNIDICLLEAARREGAQQAQTPGIQQKIVFNLTRLLRSLNSENNDFQLCDFKVAIKYLGLVYKDKSLRVEAF